MLKLLEEIPVHTVLLVEADPEARSSLDIMLTAREYAVYSAENHKKALAMLNTMPFSILLSCCSPRRMTYEEFALEVKSYQSSLPIITVVNANEFTALEKSSLVDKVLNKPFSIELVDEAIQTLLKKC